MIKVLYNHTHPDVLTHAVSNAWDLGVGIYVRWDE